MAPERRPPEPPEESLPDAAALIERLRRQRQQREQSRGRGERPEVRERSARSPRSEHPSPPVAQRFAAGDRIFCLPYGDGVVQASFVEDGHELLTVQFPDHGELEIDPALSLVRKLEADRPIDDDPL
jgi:hypothetical protein